MTAEQEVKSTKFKSRDEYNIRLVITEENDGTKNYKIAWAQKLIRNPKNNSGTWVETGHKLLAKQLNKNEIGVF